MSGYDKREISVINVDFPRRPIDKERMCRDLNRTGLCGYMTRMGIMSVEEMNEKIAMLDIPSDSHGASKEKVK